MTPSHVIRSLDIAALTAAYAAGTLTPEAVIKEVYRRIGALGERPIWITIEPKEKALAALAKAPKGPLWGIPFAVKDNIDVAGVPTTCACPEFERVPTRSATVVERLEAAGAVLIGKTNLDQFATGLNGTRSPYGACTSPFDESYISGGSSSGSAAAVARGLVSFALGTDTAGSGRVPAAFNNIVGLKPTKGLLSTRGLVPACRSQDVISVLALTTSDAAIVTATAAGFDPEDPFSRESPEGFTLKRPATPPRIGVPETLEFLGDGATAALYAKAVETLKRQGAEIVRFDLAPFLEAAKLLYAGPWVAERLAAIKEFAEASPAAIIEPVRKIILGAKDLTATDVFEGLYQLAELVRATEPAWRAMDAMLLPTAPTTYKIEDMLRNPVRLNSNLGLYTNFVNLCDLAAIAVPAGFRPDGLPAGVTLIGPAFSDGVLAPVADALHRSLADAKLGATAAPLAATPALVAPPAKRTTVDVAVVGAHLSGQPLNGQLVERHATLLETTRTAKGYRLFALPGTTPPKPGLVCDGAGEGGLEIEIWRMSYEAFGSFVDLIPQPLGIGTLTLADGRTVKGFLCEAHATEGALDITGHGGWRAWLSAR